jgi:hypothetical protein
LIEPRQGFAIADKDVACVIARQLGGNRLQRNFRPNAAGVAKGDGQEWRGNDSFHESHPAW